MPSGLHLPKKALRWAAYAATAGLLSALPEFLPNRFWVSVLITILFKTLLTSSLRLTMLMGFISLGHVGFMLIGAYASALLALKGGVPVLLSIPSGAALAALFAALVGYPFLRLKGVYFVVLTFLMAEALRLTALYATGLTGGEPGLSRIPGLPDVHWFGGVWSPSEGEQFYRVLLVLTALVLGLLYGLERSRFGLYCRAIAQSEPICRAAGLDTTRLEIANFTLAAGVAGFTGALWAHYETVLAPTFSSIFGMLSSIFLLVYLQVGGRDHFWGPLAGVTSLVLLEQLAQIEEQRIPILLGACVMLAVFAFPSGVTGVLGRLFTRVPRQARSA
jgi:branched-chain amino acid transport system permease protein